MHPRRPRPRRAQAAFSSAVLLLLLLTALAPRAAAPEDAAPAKWAPAEPELGKSDWARIDSGEWIKGELIVLQSDTMFFDSDKFDELEVEWEDVLDLRLSKPRVFRLTGNRVYNGTGDLRDGILRVHVVGGEVVEIPRIEIVSITYTEELELQHWFVRIGANLAARSGNTDQQDVGGNALIRRDATYTRWENHYNGAFGKVDGTQTTNNHRATTFLDLLVTNHFFVRVPTFEFYKDKFQNIDARYTAGAGVGYEPIDNKFAEYRVTIGAAGQVSQFDGGTQDTDAALLFTSDLSLDLPRDLDLDLKYALQLLITDIGRTAHSTSAILSFEIWDPIDLDIGAY